MQFWRVNIAIILNIFLIYLIDTYYPNLFEQIIYPGELSDYIQFTVIFLLSGIFVYMQRSQHIQKNYLLQKKNDELHRLYNNVKDSVKYAYQIQNAIKRAI